MELIVGEKKHQETDSSDQTVAELGLSKESKLSAALKRNVACCSNRDALGVHLDPEVAVCPTRSPS